MQTVEQQRIWDHFQTAGVSVFEHGRGRHAALIRESRRRLGSSGRVLNVGIGSGIIERRLLRDGWQVSALDPSREVVERLSLSGVDARIGVGQEMPFADGSFDLVIVSEVLEHIEATLRPAVYGEIARVLRRPGWIIGSVPYRENLLDNEVVCPDCGKIFHRWGHVSCFDLPDIRQELSNRFDVVLCRRVAFVDWTNATTPFRLIKASAHYLLGRLGEPIASPSILFAARALLAQ